MATFVSRSLFIIVVVAGMMAMAMSHACHPRTWPQARRCSNRTTFHFKNWDIVLVDIPNLGDTAFWQGITKDCYNHWAYCKFYDRHNVKDYCREHDPGLYTADTNVLQRAGEITHDEHEQLTKWSFWTGRFIEKRVTWGWDTYSAHYRMLHVARDAPTVPTCAVPKGKYTAVLLKKLDAPWGCTKITTKMACAVRTAVHHVSDCGPYSILYPSNYKGDTKERAVSTCAKFIGFRLATDIHEIKAINKYTRCTAYSTTDIWFQHRPQPDGPYGTKMYPVLCVGLKPKMDPRYSCLETGTTLYHIPTSNGSALTLTPYQQAYETCRNFHLDLPQFFAMKCVHKMSRYFERTVYGHNHGGHSWLNLGDNDVHFVSHGGPWSFRVRNGNAGVPILICEKRDYYRKS